jgi:tetratricopeptide (TPR) repeat protein
MTPTRLLLCLPALLLLATAAEARVPLPSLPKPVLDRLQPPAAKGDGQKQPAPRGDRLPLAGLPPAKLVPDLCLLKYRISTTSPQCQALFDQGLGFFYSYVWMEASRSFETAVKHDPNCAIAWWALSRALERYGKGNQAEALKKAHALIDRASHRESLLIKARLQEKGMWPNVGTARMKAAVETIDTLLALYPDDEEGWYYRAQLAAEQKLFGGQTASAPFYHALLKINPLHPGANHELVHFYENIKRPALGWRYAEKYMESSLGVPHAFHMQAHLGMRIGRWDRTTEHSARAVEIQTAYHKLMDVKPSQDSQFAHHVETLMRSLIHDGRFDEARRLKKLSQDAKIESREHKQLWVGLHLAERDWAEALKLADTFRKGDKATASYYRALVYLRKGDPERAAPEVRVLQQAYQGRRERQLEMRLWETLGMLMCQQGDADGGLKLLWKTVEKTKDSYDHHRWGNGAYYMEWWGAGALRANRLDVAEEAFLEALAHDACCVRAALGMQVVCERLGRSEEAARFAELAQRCWRRAAPSALQAELAALRGQDATPAATEDDQR